MKNPKSKLIHAKVLRDFLLLSNEKFFYMLLCSSTIILAICFLFIQLLFLWRTLLSICWNIHIFHNFYDVLYHPAAGFCSLLIKSDILKHPAVGIRFFTERVLYIMPSRQLLNISTDKILTHLLIQLLVELSILMKNWNTLLFSCLIYFVYWCSVDIT